MKTHNHSNSGGTRPASPTYRSWKAMKTRCTNRNHLHFGRYGGRGLTYDARWETFQNFLDDMGERPAGLTLDRKDNNQGYCKENCRWVTPKEQANNRKNSRVLCLGEVRMTLQQWADKTGITRTAIRDRLNRGWSLFKAVTAPVQK